MKRRPKPRLPEYRKPEPKAEPAAKRRCHRCRGMGRAPCQICNGSGQVAKGRDRLGNQLFGRCEGCFGIKTIRCSACGGEGFI